ncbi:MFS transporter [Desulfosarcina alkanivorans]|uniref:MFS transporter n=1 Tax=Desulfosarcina alkanivorans TaxID=571177 RepID=A0A5K7YQ81_9BACT|nr:MFS transporter [Desulfosarcina alkanivorans]BBO70485.1 MFS transporter [Desulfosarcina alkanivorans]
MDHVKKNPMFLYLVVLTIGSTVGLQAWTTLFNNFAVEVARLDGDGIGMIQSIREIPGFLALLAIFVIRLIPEHRLSALSILLLGVGIAATGCFPSFAGLALTTLVMSFGFHYYETTNMSLTLQYFDRHTSPWVFGKLRSISAASSIVVGVFIFFMASVLDFSRIYLLVGGGISAVALWGFSRRPASTDVVPQRKRMVLRKRYWLYYFLAFMAGARRQIFIAFSVLLLVQKFGYSVQAVTSLFVLNNCINFFLSPTIGRAIIRFGERKVLTVEYTSLVAVFLAYAFTDSRWVAGGLYILDHIFFNFGMAINTYFQKVGDPGDMAPTMAVGFTINHIAAVFLPAIGGYFWIIDYRIPFIAGAVMASISLIAVQKIHTPPSFPAAAGSLKNTPGR